MSKRLVFTALAFLAPLVIYVAGLFDPVAAIATGFGFFIALMTYSCPVWDD